MINGNLYSIQLYINGNATAKGDVRLITEASVIEFVTALPWADVDTAYEFT